MYEKLSGFSDEIHPSVDVQFQVLRKLGINYFEPRGIDGKSISELTDAEVSTLRDKMERNGIRVSSIGSPIGKVNLKEPFSGHFALFQRVVEIAKQLDAAIYQDVQLLSRRGRCLDATGAQGSSRKTAGNDRLCPGKGRGAAA